MTLALAALGAWSFTRLPIDATPDITNVQVQINTDAPGYSPLEAEQRVTFPLETALAGLAGLDYTRSLSRYGLSQVTVVFEDGTDIYFARQQVAERLQQVGVGSCRPGVEPELGPVATGLGEIFMYTVEAEPALEATAAWTATDLRTLQDWVVRPQLRTRSGRHRGQHDRRLRAPDPRHARTPLDWSRSASRSHDVTDALARNNENVGAGYIERNGQQYLVRVPGQVADLEALRRIVLARRDGVPIRVGDVAEVGEGAELRTGAATQNGKEVVLGTVFMLVGENSRARWRRPQRPVSRRSARSLPDGRDVPRPVYDRTDAGRPHHRARSATNLVEGALLVVVVLFAAARQLARGADHRGGDPAVDAAHRHRHGARRRVRQPDEPGRARFRPDRRWRGDHHRELPAPVRRRAAASRPPADDRGTLRGQRPSRPPK